MRGRSALGHHHPPSSAPNANARSSCWLVIAAARASAPAIRDSCPLRCLGPVTTPPAPPPGRPRRRPPVAAPGRGGDLTPPPHRSGREPLDSFGSSHPAASRPARLGNAQVGRRVSAAGLAASDGAAPRDTGGRSATVGSRGMITSSRPTRSWAEFTAWCAGAGWLRCRRRRAPITGYLTDLARAGAKVGTMSRRL